MPTHTFQNRKPERGLLPDGKHKLRVVDWESKLSQQRNDMIVLKVKGDGAGSFFDHLVFTESSEWKIDQFLVAIGKAPKIGESVDFGDDLLKNAEAWANVGHEEYTHNGEKRVKNVVVEWLPPQETPAQTISKAEPDQFD